MPTSNVVARLLLKQGKAKCIRRTPFCIKLLNPTTTYTQPCTLGIDTGSGTIGSAVVATTKAETPCRVLYQSQVEVRNDIASTLEKRKNYRRNRRYRKTRYRKARFLNRRNSIKKGRFSPTMVSKVNAHLKEIRFVSRLLPVSRLIIETATFDPHALKNPAVLENKLLYQQGLNYGFANTKAYVLHRDGYKCQHCKGKSKDQRLEVHHVVFRSQGGSDDAQNLLTLCGTCHRGVHEGSIQLKKKGKAKGTLSHATQMNSIRQQLLKQLPYAEETFGYITKEHRQHLGLPKEHALDAVAIACQGQPISVENKVLLLKKCVSDGDYQQRKGKHSQERIPTGKLYGFRKFDKVRYKIK